MVILHFTINQNVSSPSTHHSSVFLQPLLGYDLMVVQLQLHNSWNSKKIWLSKVANFRIILSCSRDRNGEFMVMFGILVSLILPFVPLCESDTRGDHVDHFFIVHLFIGKQSFSQKWPGRTKGNHVEKVLCTQNGANTFCFSFCFLYFLTKIKGQMKREQIEGGREKWDRGRFWY